MTELLPHICKKCGIEYPLAEYAVNKTYAAGRDNTCRQCRLTQRRVNYHKNTAKKPPKSKTCATCSETKPSTDFPKGGSADGLKSQCKDCKNFRAKAGRYNISRATFLALLESQGGVCAVCTVEVSPITSYHVDHDHSCCPYGASCGECIRGLLCGNCNTLVVPGYEKLPVQLQKCPVINKYLGGV